MKICFRFINKTALLLVGMFFIFLFVSAQAFAWQGRMAGAGDAYGLCEDESDFLIHPAAIASSGKETNFYGSYRLTYDYVPKWDNKMDVPSLNRDYPFEAKGHEWKNEGQLGMASTLGTGRIGFFFDYLGKRAKYKGEENDYGSTTNDFDTKIQSKTDNFNFRTLYGKPLGSIKLGGELQISHKDEENKNTLIDSAGSLQNAFRITNSAQYDLYKYMIPFRSDYYEAFGKLSIEGALGSVKNTFTVKGGTILPFASNNKYNYHNSGGTEVSMDGEVKSWNAGLDYWVRFPLNKDVSLPFVISISHKKTERDGSGNSNTGFNLTYKHQTEDTNATIGGGTDFNLSKGSRIAIGLYYDYLRTNQIMKTIETAANTDIYNYPEYPSKKENRVTLKAMNEIKNSSGFSFLCGLNVFYGKVKNNFLSNRTRNSSAQQDTRLSMDGNNWGVNLSFGTNFKTDKVTIEPFINAGFYRYKVNGNGYYDWGLIESGALTGESEKTDWLIGGGLSVKY